jgi:hypothetical protein
MFAAADQRMNIAFRYLKIDTGWIIAAIPVRLTCLRRLRPLCCADHAGMTRCSFNSHCVSLALHAGQLHGLCECRVRCFLTAFTSGFTAVPQPQHTHQNYTTVDTYQKQQKWGLHSGFCSLKWPQIPEILL